MAEIEQAAAEFIAGELDAGDDATVASTSADFAPFFGGPGTVDSLKGTSKNSPFSGVVDLESG